MPNSTKNIDDSIQDYVNNFMPGINVSVNFKNIAVTPESKFIVSCNKSEKEKLLAFLQDLLP